MPVGLSLLAKGLRSTPRGLEWILVVEDVNYYYTRETRGIIGMEI